MIAQLFMAYIGGQETKMEITDIEKWLLISKQHNMHG